MKLQVLGTLRRMRVRKKKFFFFVLHQKAIGKHPEKKRHSLLADNFFFFFAPNEHRVEGVTNFTTIVAVACAA
jgi:hypothetical protein